MPIIEVLRGRRTRRRCRLLLRNARWVAEARATAPLSTSSPAVKSISKSDSNGCAGSPELRRS
jgi:hypothetical protein